MLAIVDRAIGLAIAVFVFRVLVLGSMPLRFAVAGLYHVVMLGIGLLVSTHVDTQQQATFVTFHIMMIDLLMSGPLTPVDSMPHWFRSHPNSTRCAISCSVGARCCSKAHAPSGLLARCDAERSRNRQALAGGADAPEADGVKAETVRSWDATFQCGEGAGRADL